MVTHTSSNISRPALVNHNGLLADKFGSGIVVQGLCSGSLRPMFDCCNSPTAAHGPVFAPELSCVFIGFADALFLCWPLARTNGPSEKFAGRQHAAPCRGILLHASSRWVG